MAPDSKLKNCEFFSQSRTIFSVNSSEKDKKSETTQLHNSIAYSCV